MVNGHAVSQRRDYLANEADFILVFERLRSSLSRFAVSMSWRSKYLPSTRNNFQPPGLGWIANYLWVFLARAATL